MVERFGVAALPPPQVGEAEMGVSLPNQVAGLAVQIEGPSKVGVGVVETAQPGASVGEEAVDAGLYGRVGQPPGGRRRSRPAVARSCQCPRRSRKVRRVKASCHVWVSNPSAAA
jgi:hypothetical protein